MTINTEHASDNLIYLVKNASPFPTVHEQIIFYSTSEPQYNATHSAQVNTRKLTISLMPVFA